MKFTLKGLRNQFGLSRTKEARLINVSPWTIANCENGVHAPNSKTLIKIAKLYHIPLNEITLKPSYDLPSKKGENQ